MLWVLAASWPLLCRPPKTRTHPGETDCHVGALPEGPRGPSASPGEVQEGCLVEVSSKDDLELGKSLINRPVGKDKRQRLEHQKRSSTVCVQEGHTCARGFVLTLTHTLDRVVSQAQAGPRGSTARRNQRPQLRLTGSHPPGQDGASFPASPGPCQPLPAPRGGSGSSPGWHQSSSHCLPACPMGPACPMNPSEEG